MEDPCSFDLLPDAVVLDILSRFARASLQDQGAKAHILKWDACEQLIRLQLVCRRWQGLLFLLPELGWRLKGPADERGLVKFLARSPGFLRRLRLSLSTRYKASPELQARLAGVCGSLRELEMVQLRDPEAGPEQCLLEPHFDYVALLNSLSPGGALQTISFTSHVSLASRQTLLPLPSILHLNLTSAFISDNTLQTITDCCPNLRTLHLDYVRGLQDTLIQSPPLQSLKISTGPFPESLSIDATSLTSMDLSVGEMLSIAAPNLRTLTIGSGLPELEVRQQWNVSTLQLRGYYWIWDYIETLLRVCPNLTSLDIDVKNQLSPGVSVPIRTFLWELCPNVREVKLALGVLEILECSEDDVAGVSGERLPMRTGLFEVDGVTTTTLRQIEFFLRSASFEALQLVVLGSSRPALNKASGALAALLELEESWAVLEVTFVPACPGWTQWRIFLTMLNTSRVV
ncbi:hypothetical protein KFL_000340190 [Klebsormidium nitens]|uniref:F-box/LRR-repeat protein 15/At3g58940/PEG3-like LRR domain-containing protein n=1 Tax=Klebsormidium nitens TaxID=105231 RepID=A0A1Y1HST0_KLENI|nr:hypothetical protein KFL_000340190 [Klebsormidium nitens]|eukprot:GAQ79616.1 hypothetical protein KFL_000340190 [Klebsormidium nitens]